MRAVGCLGREDDKPSSSHLRCRHILQPRRVAWRRHSILAHGLFLPKPRYGRLYRAASAVEVKLSAAVISRCRWGHKCRSPLPTRPAQARNFLAIVRQTATKSSNFTLAAFPRVFKTKRCRCWAGRGSVAEHSPGLPPNVISGILPALSPSVAAPVTLRTRRLRARLLLTSAPEFGSF